MIPVVVAMPFVLGVLFVIGARRRARQQGTEFSMRRAVLVVVLAGGAGAVVAALALLILQGLSG